MKRLTKKENEILRKKLIEKNGNHCSDCGTEEISVYKIKGDGRKTGNRRLDISHNLHDHAHSTVKDTNLRCRRDHCHFDANRRKHKKIHRHEKIQVPLFTYRRKSLST